MNKKIIFLICLCQIIGNGSMYFSLPLLINYISIRDSTSIHTLQAALSSAFVLSALLSPFVGRCIDATSGKTYLAFWSIVAGVGFGLIMFSSSIVEIGFLFFLNQVSANFCVYEAVYPPILRVLNGDKNECNRIINWIIISCSMSPSFTWPLCEYIYSNIGFNCLLSLFAGANILICAPVYYFCFRNDVQSVRHNAREDPNGHLKHASKQTRRIVLVNVFLCAVSYALNGVYYNMKYLCNNVAFTSENMADYGILLTIGAIAMRFYYLKFGKSTGSFDQIIIVAVSFACVTFTLMTGGKVAMISLFLLAFGICQSSVLFLRTALPAEHQNNSDIGRILGLLGMCRRLAVAFAPIGFNLQERFFGLKSSIFTMCLIVLLLCFMLLRSQSRTAGV